MARSEVEDGKELEKFVLWREVKKVVKTLREELGSEKGIKGVACGLDSTRIPTRFIQT